MAVLKFEGQQLEIDERMAQNDKALLEFVATFSPEMANATITKKKEGEQTVVTLTKRAGAKGSDSESAKHSTPRTDQKGVLTALIAAPPHLNPALLLSWELKRAEAAGKLELDQLLELQCALETALTEGEAEAQAVEESLKLLIQAPATPFLNIPPGF